MKWPVGWRAVRRAVLANSPAARSELHGAIHWMAVVQHEQIKRPHAQQDQRVARQAVGLPAPPRELAVLAHGQRIDVADAPAAQVAGGGVVDGMRVPPVPVRGQGQDADDPAGPVVRLPAAEEGAVTAIVLDHEQAHEEACRGYGQQQAEPVGIVEAEPHREPQAGERQSGDGKLGQAPGELRLTVRC